MALLRFVFAAFLAVACFTDAALAQTPAKASKTASTKASSAKAAAPSRPSDAEIESEIKAKLAKGKLAKDNFQVKVKNGVVTFTGKTDVLQHKGTATRFAHVAGATDVDNQIEVSEAAKAKATANLSKARKATVK